MNDKPFMPEKEMLIRRSFKSEAVTENYNTFANECAGETAPRGRHDPSAGGT